MRAQQQKGGGAQREERDGEWREKGRGNEQRLAGRSRCVTVLLLVWQAHACDVRHAGRLASRHDRRAVVLRERRLLRGRCRRPGRGLLGRLRVCAEVIASVVSYDDT